MARSLSHRRTGCTADDRSWAGLPQWAFVAVQPGSDVLRRRPRTAYRRCAASSRSRHWHVRDARVRASQHLTMPACAHAGASSEPLRIPYAGIALGGYEAAEERAGIPRGCTARSHHLWRRHPKTSRLPRLYCGVHPRAVIIDFQPVTSPDLAVRLTQPASYCARASPTVLVSRR